MSERRGQLMLALYNVGELRDRRVDRAVARATALDAAHGASTAARAAADRLAADSGAWVPLVNTRTVAFVSRRVHNVQVNPQWGVIADQIRVRCALHGLRRAGLLGHRGAHEQQVRDERDQREPSPHEERAREPVREH